MSNNYLQISLTLPNLGTLIFYLIFVLSIPALLIQMNAVSIFKFYFPALVMLASTLTVSGEPRYFQNLYPQEITTMHGFFSKNILNLLAIIGILLNCLIIGMTTGNLVLGLVTGIVAFMLTFPVANQVLPYLIRQTDRLLKDITVKGTRFPGNWHKYFTGIVFIIFFMAFELIILRIVKNSNLVNNLVTNNNSTTNNVTRNNTNNRRNIV
jgi:hypothetical protein